MYLLIVYPLFIFLKCVSGLTATVRFAGPATVSIADLRTNLVPYPAAHFAMIGLAPLIDMETASKGRKLAFNGQSLAYRSLGD